MELKKLEKWFWIRFRIQSTNTLQMPLISKLTWPVLLMSASCLVAIIRTHMIHARSSFSLLLDGRVDAAQVLLDW